jgi:hypothetical protein
MTCRACTHPMALAPTLAPSASSMPRRRPLLAKTRLSSRGYVARIGTALGLAFVSATEGWVVGEANGPNRWHFFIESTISGGKTWGVQHERQYKFPGLPTVPSG